MPKDEENHKFLLKVIPVGILEFDREGVICPDYSTFCEWIFATKNIAGRSIDDVLLKPCRARMKLGEAEAFELMREQFSALQLKFEEVQIHLPKQLFFVSLEVAGVERSLKVTYHPIWVQSVLEKMMLVIEDQTELLNAKQVQSKNKSEVELGLVRLMQLRSCAEDILPIVMDEISGLMELLGDQISKKEESAVLSSLHSIKGNALAAGFALMGRQAQENESYIKAAPLGASLQKDINWGTVAAMYQVLTAEWRELQSIYKALVAKRL